MSTAKRRLRFNFKTLLALATIACIVLAWRARAYFLHLHAVDTLARQGVQLGYPGDQDDGAVSLITRLRRTLGPHPILWTPNSVRMSNVDLTQDELADLQQLHSIELLHLEGIHATGETLTYLGSRDKLRIVWLDGEKPLPSGDGEGLLALREATQLERLTLENVTLPPTGLAFLNNCPHLKRLELIGISVGDNALSAIKNCFQLERLSLPGARLTSRGLDELTDLPRLTHLDLSDAHIAAGGYEAIGRLHPLESLLLAGANVADEDLLHFFDLHHLKRLDLSRTAISDEGLKYLKVLTSLELLRLENVEVSDEAIDQLDAALPGWERGE